MPEIGRQAALNQQVVQMQLDDADASGKVTADVADSHLDTDERVSLALRFYQHKYLPVDCDQWRMRQV